MKTPATEPRLMTGAQGNAGASPVTPATPNASTPRATPPLTQVPVPVCPDPWCEECRTAPLWRFRDAEGQVWEEEP